MRNDRERLQDILEAVEKITQRVGSDKEAFDDDEMLQVWVVHHLQIIGEAAYRLSPSFRAEQNQVAWDQIIGMRHILVHGYFQIDLDIVWMAVEHDLAPLKSSVEAVLTAIYIE